MARIVLVAVDPIHKDSSALSWAVQWCRATDQELLVLSAFQVGQAEVPPSFHDELVDAAHGSLDARVEGLQLKRVPHHSMIVEGDPSDAIIDVALSKEASLVVLGARGSGGFERLGLGGVAHHVAHHCQLPIVVVPKEGGQLVGGTIVVGVDGSARGLPALQWAVDAALATDSLLHAVFAYDPMADSYPHGDAANWHYQNEDGMREEIQSLHGSAVRLRVSRVGNHPVEALSEVALDDDASMIVVGTRGRGGFTSLILGRVPIQLLHHAGRPVALIHHE